MTGMVRVVAEDDHRRGVTDEQHRDPGVVEDPRGQRVVGGEHGPLLAARLGRRDVADGQRRPVAVQRLPGAVTGLALPGLGSAGWSRPCPGHPDAMSSGSSTSRGAPAASPDPSMMTRDANPEQATRARRVRPAACRDTIR